MNSSGSSSWFCSGACWITNLATKIAATTRLHALRSTWGKNGKMNLHTSDGIWKQHSPCLTSSTLSFVWSPHLPGQNPSMQSSAPTVFLDHLVDTLGDGVRPQDFNIRDHCHSFIICLRPRLQAWISLCELWMERSDLSIHRPMRPEMFMRSSPT